MKRDTAESGPDRCWVVNKQPTIRSQKTVCVIGGFLCLRLVDILFQPNGLLACSLKNTLTRAISRAVTCQTIFIRYGVDCPRLVGAMAKGELAMTAATVDHLVAMEAGTGATFAGRPGIGAFWPRIVMFAGFILK